MMQVLECNNDIEELEERDVLVNKEAQGSTVINYPQHCQKQKAIENMNPICVYPICVYEYELIKNAPRR